MPVPVQKWSLLEHHGTVMRTDWDKFYLIRVMTVYRKLTRPPANFRIYYRGRLVSVLVAFCITVSVGDRYKTTHNRQKLARMVLENGWYEAVTMVTGNSFFTDLQSSVAEKISHFSRKSVLSHGKSACFHIQECETNHLGNIKPAFVEVKMLKKCPGSFVADRQTVV